MASSLGSTPTSPQTTSRVLSIQSHVVHGYVGNKSATFPLQLLGFDVDPVNSVQFSNHTGYPAGFKGTVMDGDGLLSLMSGLTSNSLLTPSTTHLLTGYIGSVSFLNAVIDTYEKAKELTGGKIKYVCDPVMGDEGKMYVSEELLGVYKTRVIKLAYMVTPNAYEAQLLTSLPLTDLSTAKAAINALHDLGPKVVVITSMVWEEREGKLIMMVSESDVGVWGVEMDKVDGHYTGTGDLVAALLLAHEHKYEGKEEEKWPRILGNVTNTMQEIIRRTHEAGGGELRLIQSKDDIEKKGWEGGVRAWKA
mmetsp:Transcript_13001/g.26555  ORF Transcript_13001/g.26555 Transcript_13001/m.26555 type:complete len:307 (+) Transcript_13001:133-1053(+)